MTTSTQPQAQAKRDEHTQPQAQLAVFDMAGTTIDERDEVYRVLRESAEREGARFSDEEFQKWMGTEKHWAIRNLLTIGGVEATDELVDKAFAWFREELARTYTANPPSPMPHIEESFAALRAAGIRVGLTTGFSRDIADLILESMGWTVGGGEECTIDVSVCGDEVPSGRPAPDMINKVMEITGVDDPAAVISVGDTEVDVESAQAAGAFSVGVLTGHLTKEAFAAKNADAVLELAADVVNLPQVAAQ